MYIHYIYYTCMFLITQEWRHAHGMRCLGIPNTAHFANVTNIADAIACKCMIIACYCAPFDTL